MDNDRALLETCQKCLEALHRFKACFPSNKHLPPEEVRAAEREQEERAEALYRAEVEPLLLEIETTPAVTLAGFAAKAQILILDDISFAATDAAQSVCEQMMDDLARISPLATMAPAVECPAVGDADATLIDLCEQWTRSWHSYKRSEAVKEYERLRPDGWQEALAELQMDFDAAVCRCGDLMDLILHTEAKSFGEAVAQLEVVDRDDFLNDGAQPGHQAALAKALRNIRRLILGETAVPAREAA